MINSIEIQTKSAKHTNIHTQMTHIYIINHRDIIMAPSWIKLKHIHPMLHQDIKFLKKPTKLNPYNNKPEEDAFHMIWEIINILITCMHHKSHPPPPPLSYPLVINSLH
jgi:hypothetical protein